MRTDKIGEGEPSEDEVRARVEAQLVENLRAIGRASGYSTDVALAKALGVSQSTLSGWMGGSGFRKVAGIAARLTRVQRSPWDLFLTDSSETLRDDESELLSGYRSLSEAHRELVRAMAAGLGGGVDLPDDRERRLLRAFRLKVQRNPRMAEGIEEVLLDELKR